MKKPYIEDFIRAEIKRNSTIGAFALLEYRFARLLREIYRSMRIEKLLKLLK